MQGMSQHMLMSFEACSVCMMCQLWRGFRSTHRRKFSSMSRHMTFIGRHMLQTCRHMIYISQHIRCIFPKIHYFFQIICIPFAFNLHTYKYFMHASFQVVENLKDTKENLIIFNLSLHMHNNYT